MSEAGNMDKQAFVAKYGAVFEHSPWVAEAVFQSNAEWLNDAEYLKSRFESAFLSSTPDRQLETLKSHPQLACALADPSELTTGSLNEQTGAGLDRCSAEELKEFNRLNADYLEKFGFPFIVAVRGLSRNDILDVFRRRLHNDIQQEFRTALQETCRIARFRIGDTVDA